MKLLESTKSNINKDKNGENMAHLKVTEVLLVQCHIVDNNYQQKWRVLYLFVCNKSLGQLLDISPKYFISSKTFDSEFQYIDVWFTDQNSNLPETEDKTNITLAID